MFVYFNAKILCILRVISHGVKLLTNSWYDEITDSHKIVKNASSITQLVNSFKHCTAQSVYL